MNDVRRGDVFALGDHRLMCGDSTDPEDVSKLMDGRTAKMVFTSPPYADIRTYGGDKNLDPQHLAKFIAAYRPYCDLFLVNLGTKRQNYEIIPYWNVYTKAANDADLKLVSINILELDPGYCRIAIGRWEQETGMQAELISAHMCREESDELELTV